MEEASVRLYVYMMKQDNPKKCTSAKLKRFRLARRLSNLSRIGRETIVLNPVAVDIFSSRDKDSMLRGGLIVIDCSWNRVEEVFVRRFPGRNRRLPLLIAANPINYGHLSKLSSIEALAAALYIAGFKAQAERLMTLYKWGEGFIALNRELMDDYNLARNELDVLRIEEAYFK